MLAPSLKPIAETVAEGDTAEILDAIVSPGCAVALWHRRLPFQDWIEALAPEALPRARLAFRPDDAEDALAPVLAEHMPDGPNRQMLAADIGGLARSFARIMKLARIRLRLDVLQDDACRRFHLDNVAARLLCTYRGRGTEYGRARTGEQPRDIHAVPTSSAGLFRGGLWPGQERSGILHRSPPIAGLGETRLLLVIDPPQEDD